MATRLGECWAGWTNIERVWWDWERRCWERQWQHLLSFLTRTESGGEVKPPLPARKRGEHQLISGNHQQPTNHSHHTASRLLPYHRSIHNYLPDFKPIHLQSRAETPWMVLIHLGKSKAWSTPILAVKNGWGLAKLIFCLDVQVVCYLAVLSALQCTGKNGGCCES